MKLLVGWMYIGNSHNLEVTKGLCQDQFFRIFQLAPFQQWPRTQVWKNLEHDFYFWFILIFFSRYRDDWN